MANPVHLFTQTEPNNVWHIAHNLGSYIPVVDVWIDDQVQVVETDSQGNPIVVTKIVTTNVIPKEIRSLDDNNIRIQFTTDQIGHVRLN